MRVQPIMLRLGVHEWRVRPLTLKQIQEIEPLLLRDQSAGHSIAAATKIIAVALTRDHPEAADRLSEIEASTRDIGIAMGDVLRLGGFIAVEAEQETGQETGQDSGKAEAGADWISAPSTPA